MTGYGEFSAAAIAVAREAGAILRDGLGGPRQIAFKGQVDLVTEMDKRSEALIVGTLTARFPTTHEAARMVHTPQQMVDELDEIHVDLAVLFPDHLLKIAVLPQADYAAALARAYNAWLRAEWTARHPALLLVDENQGPTSSPCGKTLLKRHVEAKSRELQSAGLRRRRELLQLPPQQVHQRPVRHGHALGTARGAGRVNDIGQIRRLNP